MGGERTESRGCDLARARLRDPRVVQAREREDGGEHALVGALPAFARCAHLHKHPFPGSGQLDVADTHRRCPSAGGWGGGRDTAPPASVCPGHCSWAA